MTITQLVSSIIERSKEVPTKHSMLVGISGIDASGKGYITKQLDDYLTSAGLKTAVINIDGWLNLPHIRFNANDFGGNFYRNAIRFDEMFERLVVPLRETRSIEIVADFAEETATEYREYRYSFGDTDIVLLEGIFLFKREFVDRYDLGIWVDCSFETALQRAVSRSQEGLDREATIQAYNTIYFRAQQVHFDLDDPLSAADIILGNR